MINDEKELWQRLTSVEAGTKSAHRRIDCIEKLTQSVSDMVVEVRHMREDLNGVQTELDDVKSRPSRLYDKFIGALIGAAASGIVTLLMSYIIK